MLAIKAKALTGSPEPSSYDMKYTIWFKANDAQKYFFQTGDLGTLAIERKNLYGEIDKHCDLSKPNF